MDWLVVLVGLVAAGFVAWELFEPWRLRERAARLRQRQNAASDRGED